MEKDNSTSISGSSSEEESLRTDEQTSNVDQTIDEQPSNLENNDFKKFENIIHEDMVFESEEKAFEKYNEFARKVGFSVRKGKIYKRADGTVRSRIFFCSKQGTREKDKRDQLVKKERKQTRTGCTARMIIKHPSENEWVVTEIIYQHNHPLATPSKTHLLRSQRKLKETHAAEIESLNTVGISPSDGFNFMSQQAGGCENIGITKVDYNNYLRNKRLKELGKGDASTVVNYFAKKKSENPAFFHSVMVDEENQLTNFFWADAMSIIDYNYFGDVVVFDTTYRTNRYNRPFAPFVGVNHHKQTIIFGGALLLDETTESFVWLFETWLQAMSGKAPKIIITDQCAAMAKAISIVMPETIHRLCLWHIFQNAGKHLSHEYKSPSFKYHFNRCIYTCESEEEFLSRWDKFLLDYDLVGNKWLDELFKIREKWALVYGHDTFCADMTTSQRSESINKFFKKFVKRKYSFTEFLNRYEMAVKTRRKSELETDFDQVQKILNLFVSTPMLKQAATSYTHAIFEMFEKEYKEHLMCKIEDGGVDGTIQKYEVTQDKHVHGIVSIDSSNSQVLCSCKNIDFVGIGCRHIIKALYHTNIHDLPSEYILKRWTKDAKTGTVWNQDGDPILGDRNADLSLRYNDLCRKVILIATKSAVHEHVYDVADRAMDKVLEEVELAIKAIKITSEEPKSTNDTTIENAPVNVATRVTKAWAKKNGRSTNDRIPGALERSGKKKGNKGKEVHSRENAKKNSSSKNNVQKRHKDMVHSSTQNTEIIGHESIICQTNVIPCDYSFSNIPEANTNQFTNPSGANTYQFTNQYIQGTNVSGFGTNTMMAPPNSSGSLTQLLNKVSFIPTNSATYNVPQLPHQLDFGTSTFESNNESFNPEGLQSSRRKLSFDRS